MNVPWDRVVPINQSHDCSSFSCGDEEMDQWFLKSSRSEHTRGGCIVHLATDSEARIHGFFSLSSHEVANVDIPKKAAGGMSVVPATLLGRIGLHRCHRGKDLGAWLLLEALKKAVDGSDLVGSRLIVLDAANERLAEYYAKNDFRRICEGNLRMYMKMSTARQILEDVNSKLGG